MESPPTRRRQRAGRSEIHTITLPLLFPLFPVNIYVIDGEIPTLIDTGLSTDVGWETLVQGLSALKLSPKDIRRVILTHGHIDHVGLVEKLLEAGRPEVFIHTDDADRITCDVELLVDRIEKNAVRLKKMGIAPRDVDRLFRTYISMLRRYYIRLDTVKTLAEGDTLEFSGFTLTAVHTPGHTAGSTCLFDAASRVLFSGDHIMEGTPTNPLAEMTQQEGVGLVPYLASLKRVLGILPERILPGHGPVIDAPRHYIGDIVGYHEKLVRDIEVALCREWTSPIELTRRLFPDLSGIFSSNVVFEVYSHLVQFTQEGRAMHEEREGGYYFRCG